MERISDKVICVGGREFKLFKYYDGVLEEELLEYPDFDEHPEYTADGRPFKVMADESCPHGKCKSPDKSGPGDCGSCELFYRDRPLDAIGICMCDELRLTKIENEPKKETK